MTARRALLATAVAVLIALYAVLLHWYRVAHHTLWLQGLAIPVYVAALVLLAQAGLCRRSAVVLVLGVGTALQIVALTMPPATSDDDYRYAWDAKVQLAGIDPYRYAPSSPALWHLRDAFFFHPRSRCPWPVADGACSAINRPDVRTVYPPVAQAAFVGVRLLSFGGHGGHLPLQLAAALGAVTISALLARQAWRRQRPIWTVAVWAWCPTTVLELGNGAHIDWLAVLLGVLALQTVARRPAVAGALTGAAVAVKIYPALLLPSLIRRRPVSVLAAAVAVIVVSYLPHVFAVGSDVLGFLPGYLDEQRTARNALLGLVFPELVANVVAVLVLAGVAVWAARATDVRAPERTAVVTVGTALLIGTPAFGWYALLLLALIAMSGAVEWLPVVFASALLYLVQGDFGDAEWRGQVAYACAFVAGVVVWLVRRRQASRTTQPEEVAQT